MINLNVELLSELAVDGFNKLAGGIDQLANRFRPLLALIAPRHGIQTDRVGDQERFSLCLADIALVGQDLQVMVVGQPLLAPVKSVSLAGANSKSMMIPFKVVSQCSL
jgi:hypothetical protein